MARLRIHTRNGNTIEAPFEAWIVALINTLGPDVQQELFKRVTSMQGASLIPDKFLIGCDELGTTTVVERPVISVSEAKL